MTITRKLTLAACLLAVAACSSEERDETIGTAVYSDLKGRYMSSAKPSKDAATATSSSPAKGDLSWIETNTKPLIIVLVEKMEGMAFLSFQVQNGPYKTWRTKNGASYTFKGPFVTGTKALGADLVSASVPASIQSSGSHRRTHYYLDGDDQVAPLQAECSWTFVGAETTQILNKSYATKHYKESCVAGEIGFKNDYWLDSSGITRQSRQFVSETVGYVSLLVILE
ncbi:YjbF family lipoprotein [Falsihalocynthiibacter arcticus]|nr:YjbF family lipoprotein [Falsihalocynthiibacter arcticus]